MYDDDYVFAEVDPPYENEDGHIVWPDAGDTEVCPVCDGDGVCFVMSAMGGDPDDGAYTECAHCNGKGRVAGGAQ